MSNTLLSLQHIGLTLEQRPILTDISMVIEPGQIITIIGPNGAGKTSLLRIAIGLQQPTSGLRQAIKGLRIGYMPQKLHIDASMPITVERFLQLTHGSKRDIDDALALTNIERIKHSPLQRLSGGETQRVLLARAILRKPQLLVLDEPAQGVDITGQQELYQLIHQLRDQQTDGVKTAVLMVSHDLHLVMAATDHVLCINQHLCCSGNPHDVKQHPEYLKLFGDDSSALAVYTHHHHQCDHSHHENHPNA